MRGAHSHFYWQLAGRFRQPSSPLLIGGEQREVIGMSDLTTDRVADRFHRMKGVPVNLANNGAVQLEVALRAQ